MVGNRNTPDGSAEMYESKTDIRAKNRNKAKDNMVLLYEGVNSKDEQLQ